MLKKVVPETPAVTATKPTLIQTASSSQNVFPKIPNNAKTTSSNVESSEAATTMFPKSLLEVNSTQAKVLNAKKDVSFNDLSNDEDLFTPKAKIQPKEYFEVGRLDQNTHVSSVYRNVLGQSHELSHDMVIRHEPNKFPVGIAVTTSALTNKDSDGDTFIRISPTKLNGDFVPVRNKANEEPMNDYGWPVKQKKLKQPILVDNYGSNHPDPERGGQHIAPLKSPRVLEAENPYTKNEKGTEVLPIIQQISEKSKTKVPVVRRHNDDSSFFTEDGHEILD